MYFHVMTTTTCNSQCRYCYEKSCRDFDTPLNKKWKFDFSMPEKISYNLKDLKKFLERDKKEHVITFYGGEPLIEAQKIKEIMDLINARYMIQTNGLLLNRLESKYTNRFEAILISIDGRKEITDFNKGDGTYQKVISNLNLIKENGFRGETIARMVVTEKTNLPEEVRHLLECGFDAVHWQLDAGFYSNDYTPNFKQFAEKYNKQLKATVKFWVDEMRGNGNFQKKGRVLKIYPFLGIFESLYYARKSSGFTACSKLEVLKHHKKELLRCGSGFANYTIATNGRISVCPIMHDITDFQVGDIFKNHPDELKKIYVSGFCRDCDLLDLCGGRCLYANKAELWPAEGQKLICSTIRNLINCLKQKLPEIDKLIKTGKVSRTDFEYEKYTGPEIIP